MEYILLFYLFLLLLTELFLLVYFTDNPHHKLGIGIVTLVSIFLGALLASELYYFPPGYRGNLYWRIGGWIGRKWAEWHNKNLTPSGKPWSPNMNFLAMTGDHTFDSFMTILFVVAFNLGLILMVTSTIVFLRVARRWLDSYYFPQKQKEDLRSPKIIDLLKQHSLITYFALTFAITIVWILVMVIDIIQGAQTPVQLNSRFYFIRNRFMPYIPALAAILMMYIEGRKVGLHNLLNRITKWQVEIQWYLALILVPLVIRIAALGLGVLFGGTSWPFPEFLLRTPVGSFFLNTIITSSIGIEMGWRGYALPKLQTRYNAAESSIILGVLGGFWSCLPFFVFQRFWGLDYFLIIGSFSVFLVGTIGWTFIYTWFYNNTEGSVFVAILLNAWITTLSYGYFLPTLIGLSIPLIDLVTLRGIESIFIPLYNIMPIFAAIILLAFFGKKRLSLNPEAVEAVKQIFETP